MTIGERIRIYRKSKGLTMAQFGEKLSVSGSAVSLIELGNTYPSDRIVKNILDAFPDLNPDWLANGEGEMIMLETEDDYEMMAKFLKYGKGHVAADALKAIFLMYNMLDDAQRKALDEMIHERATKKDPE